MKILSIKKYENDTLEIKIKTDRKCMCKVGSREQARKEESDIYINDKWHYVIGHEEINFVFIDLERYPVYGLNEQIKDTLFELEILINKELYRVQLFNDEIYNEKWLMGIKTQELLLISRNKYQKIIREIKPRIGEKIYFDNIGVHKINDKYFYVASNCAITSKGINKEIRALKEGFDIEFDENVEEEEYVKKFIQYNSMNLRVFYPIHYMQIIAILKYFLKKIGISAGGVLWIDGAVASGKTELSFTVGDIFNRCGDNNSIKKNLYSTKVKVKDIEKKLIEYNNAVFILDDVKKEETVRNRENTKNVTDLVVRSIYMGKLGQAQQESDVVNATAIITGEFFKEQKSTISRILYLNIGNFLQERNNSESFKKIQSDNTYFAGFIAHFTQWLFRNFEEKEQDLNLKRIVENVSEMSSSELVEDELLTRMKEMHTNMLICNQIVIKYLKYVLGEENISVNKFYKECRKVINDLMRNTWYKSLNYRPIYIRAFDSVILKAKIKDCRYGGEFLSARSGGFLAMNAFANEENRGVSLDSKISSNEKVWLLRLNRDYAGLLLNLGEGQENILILRQDFICNQMRDYIKENEKEWAISYYPSDYTDEKIIGELANSRRIFVHKRSDGTFDRIFNYPLIEDIENNEDKVEMDSHENVKMVKVNVKDNIIDRIENKEIEKVERWLGVREILYEHYRSHYYCDLKSAIDGALDKINKFLDLK